jgi:Fanconi anemia group M protein
MGRGYFIHELLKDRALEYRRYQDAIASTSLKENTLVVLPTALGKTAIALLTSLYFIGFGKVLFLAPTRPLVQQHMRTYLKMTNFKEDELAVLTGLVRPEKRIKLWNRAKIIFATPQIVVNDPVELNDFSLMIFDEAHRARKDYHYVEIAKRYRRSNPKGRILALTASPGSTKERIEEICRNLFITKIESRAEEDPDVRPYLVPVTVEWKKVSLPPSYKAVRNVLRKMLDNRIAWLAEQGFIGGDKPNKKELLELLDRIRERMEEERAGIYFEAIAQASAAIALFLAIELIESQGIGQLKAFLDRIEQDYTRGHRIIISDENYPLLQELIKLYSEKTHPKVDVLLNVLKEQISKNPKSKVLVFTQYRDTANELVGILHSSGYKAARFVGQANRYGDKGLKQSDQLALIDEFRAGKVNVLVATSIAEEGLDIAECNMVIFYEPIPSEIRLIQRKGRTGRKYPGRVVVLATKSSMDTAYLYFSFKRMKQMKRVIEELNLELSSKKRAKTLDEFL